MTDRSELKVDEHISWFFYRFFCCRSNQRRFWSSVFYWDSYDHTQLPSYSSPFLFLAKNFIFWWVASFFDSLILYVSGDPRRFLEVLRVFKTAGKFMRFKSKGSWSLFRTSEVREVFWELLGFFKSF
jgi:hypothetical protein